MGMKSRKKVGGIKHDGGKPRLDLVPPEATALLSQNLTVGAHKYSPRNWEEGLEWGRCIAAAKRHLDLFAAGVDMDPDCPTLSNIGGALCNLAFLAAYSTRGTGLDDRPRLTDDQKQSIIRLLSPMALPESK